MSAAGMSSQEKEELMRTVQAQVALANMQELLSVRSCKTCKKCLSFARSEAIFTQICF